MKCVNHKSKDAVALLERKHKIGNKTIKVSIGLCEKCFSIWSRESGFEME